MSRDTTPFDLVVMGCSAGGLRALQQLLGRLRTDFPLPVVIACHTGNQPIEGLRGLLARQTNLRIAVARERARASGDCIYMAPAGYHLLIENGLLFALSVDPPVHYSRPAIDPLFESAALAAGSAAIGVLLTGGNSDGTRGLAEIRKNGGIALVQDPAEAEFPQMPQAAIDAGAFDFRLPLDGIADWLNRSAA